MQDLNAYIPQSLLDAMERLTTNYKQPRGSVAQAVRNLSHRFTKDRASLKEPYLNDLESATAYLRYFFPVNYAKIRLLLEEMPRSEKGDRFSVLDLGSGPGTGSLAVLEWWRRSKLGGRLAVSAVDSSRLALSQAAELWKTYCCKEAIEDAELRICEADVERENWCDQIKKQVPFDLIILGNCLNEIHTDAKDPIAARAGLIAEILRMTSQHGTVMIVEPASRETSRALHHVRDRLVQGRLCTVFSPCLHENGCPALANPHDWCHEERDWDPPASVRELDKEVGFIKDALKFSYLLLRKDGKTIVERRSDVYRVVSELRVMKGEKRVWLCNELGRQEIGRQDRLASPHNAPFDRWHRGAIVWIEKIRHGQKNGKMSVLGRVEQDATVLTIRPV